MKKLLITILIALVLTLTIFTVVNGLEVGNFEILGLRGIQDKSASLEKVVTEATKLATSDFPNKVKQLNTSMEALKKKKIEYEDMIVVSSAEDIQIASQLAMYKIDFLWARIGTHATSEGVVIKMEITNGSGAANTYNLNFTVNGGYINIAEFIRDIEDDSKLGFKIEEFSMKAGSSTSDLQATFVCKDVPIEGISQTTQSAPTPEATNTTSGNTTSSNTSNTTNNTNTTNTANTTNSTNATNTANTTK